MRRVARVKLLPTPIQELALADTLRVCNAAATYVSQVAFGGRDSQGRTGNKIILQDVLYQDVKSRFGLGAQPALRVIGKTVDAYTTLRANLLEGNLGLPGSPRRTKAESKPVVFRPDAAQPFDKNCLSWQHDAGTVSIWSTTGRLRGVRFVGQPSDLKLLATNPIGETDLQFQDGHWFLIATLTLPTTPVVEPAAGFVGVDLGIVNIAFTATDRGVAVADWSGGAITLRRKKNLHLRTKLQAKGTKSTKRLLKKRSKREARFVTDVNHQVSNKIVTEAQRTGHGIAIEDLTGIRERVRLRKPQQVALHSWAFAQLGAFLTYKAEGAGVVIIPVDPAYTSQTCSECGFVSRLNRPHQAEFACRGCGVLLHADHNAAVNIARRGAHDLAELNAVAINQPGFDPSEPRRSLRRLTQKRRRAANLALQGRVR
ncbi:MAG: RNA-guided endonuclease InsQ/TnpB family protein [Dermatophilaceae bacterium]